MVGASFDTVEEQRAFVEEESFPFMLISDNDRKTGELYEVVRPSNDPIPKDFPLRCTYLISPEGSIAAAWDLNASKDLGGHAGEVLDEIISQNKR